MIFQRRPSGRVGSMMQRRCRTHRRRSPALSPGAPAGNTVIAASIGAAATVSQATVSQATTADQADQPSGRALGSALGPVKASLGGDQRSMRMPLCDFQRPVLGRWQRQRELIWCLRSWLMATLPQLSLPARQRRQRSSTAWFVLWRRLIAADQPVAALRVLARVPSSSIRAAEADFRRAQAEIAAGDTLAGQACLRRLAAGSVLGLAVLRWNYGVEQQNIDDSSPGRMMSP